MFFKNNLYYKKMSSSIVLQEILEYKQEIEKDLKVNQKLLIIFYLNRMKKQLSIY